MRRVKTDPSRDFLMTQFGLSTIIDQHMVAGELSPQDAFARAAMAYADDEGHAQRLYDYASRHWFMFATPLLANGGTDRGLPISCFLNYVGDSREGILSHYFENGMLASMGGGIGTYWGHVRSNKEKTSKGSASSGIIPFTKVVDSEILAFSQGVTRRGAAAVYIDVDHPEIEEWLSMRRKSGGDPNRKTFNLHHGICVPDAFMEAVEHGQTWDLIDPHSRRVRGHVSARDLWRNILITRVETGEPYLFFSDTANRALPKPLADLGLRIHASNLCTEIMLPTSADRTAVCCLSSVNLARWDEWRDNDQFIIDLMRMLDNTLTSYIEMAPRSHYRAICSARRERSVGLGALGFHTFLQDRGVPFDSPMARIYNRAFFQHLQTETNRASLGLGAERGEAPDMVGTGHRFAHRMAVAPNSTSAIVCGGVSPSIEPVPANAYLHKTLTGSFIVKNPILNKALSEHDRNDPEVWTSIAQNRGSVQHLDFLTDNERRVFRTAIEIDQHALIQLAADRQPFIDQGQSVNLFVPNDVLARDLHAYHFEAWRLGLKALYYLRSNALKRADLGRLLTERAQTPQEEATDGVCISCEG